MQDNGATNVWRFAGCELHEASHELLVDGSFVPLERKSWELLLYLLRRPGEVVTRDDVIRDVWPGRVITENVVSRTAMKLRKALNDPDHEILTTVHGYGYRLVAEVEFIPSDDRPAAPRVPAPSAPHKTWLRWTAFVGAAVLLSLTALLLWNPMGTATAPRLAILPVKAQGSTTPDWVRLGLMGLLNRQLQARFEVLSAHRVLAHVKQYPDATTDDRIAALRNAYGPLEVLETAMVLHDEVVKLEFALYRPGRSPLRGEIKAVNALAAGERLAQRLLAEAGADAGFYRADPLALELFARGKAAMLRGDARAARDYLTAALRENPKLPWARYELALAQRQLGELEAARDGFQRLIAQGGGMPKLKVAALSGLAIQDWRDGRLDLAEAGLRKALDLAELHGIEGETADLLLNIGIVHSSRGEFETAKKFYLRALAAYRAREDREGVASVHNSLGVLAWKQGDMDRSYTEHHQSLELRRQLNTPRDLAASLNNVATILMAWGQWTRATELLQQARALRMRLGDGAGLAITERNLGKLALLQGRYDAAMAHAQESHRLAIEHAYAKAEAESVALQAEIEAKRDNPLAARELYRQAIQLYGNLGRAGYAKVLRLSAATLPGTDPELSRQLVESVLADPDAGNLEKIKALILRADLSAQQSPMKAEADWRHALASADKLGNRGFSVQTALAYGEFLLGRERLSEIEPLLGRLGAWPEYAPALRLRARYWQRAGDPARALSLLREARLSAHQAWTEEDQLWLQQLEVRADTVAQTDGAG